MTTIICPNCQLENRSTARFCQKCGATLSDAPPLAGENTVAVGASETLVTLPAGSTPLQRLPDGAFVLGPAGKEYLLDRLISDSPSLNLYQMTAQFTLRPCPHCQHWGNGDGDQFCTVCGQDIRQVQPVYLPFLVKESNRADLFAVERYLWQADLTDAALRLPMAAFDYPVGEGIRYYLVSPWSPAGTLADKTPPQEIANVIPWGVALAKGLASLHQRHIAFGPIAPQRATIEGQQALWIDFSQCRQQGQPAQFKKEVSQLAEMLFYLLTGQRRFIRQKDWPEALNQLFEQSLASNPNLGAADFAKLLEDSLARMRRPGSIDVRIGRRTDVGVQRQLNEDSLLTLDLTWNNRSVNVPMGVYVVADGMGGHAAGEVASGLVVQSVAKTAIQELLLPTAGVGQVPDYEQWLKKAVQTANATVFDRGKATGHDMGTTLVMVLLVEDEIYVGHVGDSRVYLISPQEIRQLTVDHSLVERLVATKQITREEARHHPQKNVIYRTMGDKRNVEVETSHLPLKMGERVLLCSDGLSGMVTDEKLHELIMTAPSPQVACDRLIQAANAAGGEDNITAVILQLDNSTLIT